MADKRVQPLTNYSVFVSAAGKNKKASIFRKKILAWYGASIFCCNAQHSGCVGSSPPVWENSLQIAKFNSPRIFMSEGCEPVENTGFAGQIVISWFIVGSMWQKCFLGKHCAATGFRGTFRLSQKSAFGKNPLQYLLQTVCGVHAVMLPSTSP